MSSWRIQPVRCFRCLEAIERAEQNAVAEVTMADPEAGRRTAEFFKAVNEYRKHPMLNNNMKRSTPGLGIAVIAFGVYLFVDGMASKLGKGGHDSEH